MTKKTEALKLAFKQAFDLGQTYWSWADSEYQSHWKKADAAKERFNQLVEDTIRELLAEQPAQQCKYGNKPLLCTSNPMDCQCALDAVFEQPAQKRPQNCGTGFCSCIECVMEPAQPQQEPVTLGYMNAGHVHEMQQGRLPYGYVYPKRGAGASAAVYASPPAQRKPLTDEEIIGWVESGEYNVITNDWASHIDFARAIEAAHGIKENT